MRTSALFVAVATLAEAVGRVPVGEWTYGPFITDARIRLFLNGGPQKVWRPEAGIEVARFHAFIEVNGWPAAILNPTDGSVAMSEDELLAALERETVAVMKGSSS